MEYLFEVFTDDDRILETLPVELDLTPLGAGFRGPGNEDLLLTFGDSTSVKIRIGIDESEPPVNRQRRRDAAVLVEVRVDLPVQGIQIEPLGHLKQAEQAAVFNRLGLCDPRPGAVLLPVGQRKDVVLQETAIRGRRHAGRLAEIGTKAVDGLVEFGLSRTHLLVVCHGFSEKTSERETAKSMRPPWGIASTCAAPPFGRRKKNGHDDKPFITHL